MPKQGRIWPTRGVTIGAHCLPALLMALVVLGVVRPGLAGDVTVRMVSGEAITGKVITGTVNMLSINKSFGGYAEIPRPEIASIGVATGDGAVVEGQFIDWQNGRLVLRSGDRLVYVKDGVIEDAEPDSQPDSQEASVPAVLPVVPVLETAEPVGEAAALEPVLEEALQPALQAADAIEAEVAGQDEADIPVSEPIEEPTM